MALINGNNTSGKMFDVVDEEGEVIGSFDDRCDAITCGNHAPFYHGRINIRRDIKLHLASHVRNQELLRANRAMLDCAA